MGNLQGLLERDAREAREQLVFGLVTAIVDGIEEDGTYTVEYLSMGSEGYTSAPARVMMPMAGNGRGTYFMPEVGDEVVVAFEGGDTSFPIILGAVWNDDGPPPDQAQPSTDNNLRTIVSRSGHEVTFDDSPGAQKVTIKTQGGHELEFDDTPPGRVRLRSNGGGELEISDAAGALTIRAPVSITFESPSISVASTGGSLTLEARGGVQVKTTGTIQGSALMIEGTPFSAHVHSIGTPNTGPVVGP